MNVKTGLTKYRSDKYKANKSQQQTLLKVQLIIVQLEYPGFLIDFHWRKYTNSQAFEKKVFIDVINIIYTVYVNKHITSFGSCW